MRRAWRWPTCKRPPSQRLRPRRGSSISRFATFQGAGREGPNSRLRLLTRVLDIVGDGLGGLFDPTHLLAGFALELKSLVAGDLALDLLRLLRTPPQSEPRSPSGSVRPRAHCSSSSGRRLIPKTYPAAIFAGSGEGRASNPLIPEDEPVPTDPLSDQINRLLDLTTSDLMDHPETDDPLPPFFEFSSSEAATFGLHRPWQRRLTPTFKLDADDFVVYLLDGPGSIQQEPWGLEEFGPDGVFDSRGRQAELGIEDFAVVVKRWSEQPNVDVFDRLLRAAAASYLRQIDVGALSTAELRGRLVPVLRQYEREQMLFWPAEKLARNLWRLLSRRSGQ